MSPGVNAVMPLLFVAVLHEPHKHHIRQSGIMSLFRVTFSNFHDRSLFLETIYTRASLYLTDVLQCYGGYDVYSTGKMLPSHTVVSCTVLEASRFRGRRLNSNDTVANICFRNDGFQTKTVSKGRKRFPLARLCRSR